MKTLALVLVLLPAAALDAAPSRAVLHSVDTFYGFENGRCAEWARRAYADLRAQKAGVLASCAEVSAAAYYDQALDDVTRQFFTNVSLILTCRPRAADDAAPTRFSDPDALSCREIK